MTKKTFDVFGMTCAACQAHVEKAASKVSGVKKVSVNLLKNNMVVEFDEKVCSPADIELAVSNAGYKAEEKGAAKKTSADLKPQKDYALAKLITCIVLLLVLMYFSMGNMMWGFPSPDVFDHTANPVGFALLQFLLVLPILFIYRGYFSRGFKRLFKGKPNMDTLIAIGSAASMIYGIFAIFMMTISEAKIAAGIDAEKWAQTLATYHESLYFESAGMILTLVSLGKYLEGLSKKKTTSAVTKLMDLAPKRAVVLRENGEEEIPAEEVRIGDTVIVKNGESIPVDGEVIDGSASVDQSNITGESMPVFKKAGDEVYSSTTLTAGYLKLRASKVGEDTSIAAIIRLVDEASSSKAPISRLADKISGIFVPIILGIALITLIANLIAGSSFELSLNFAITVIVIACPCALGLATPVCIMAGTGKGAQNGLLIKNAEILEKAHLIKTVVLDKTGTLTEGKPKVTDYSTFGEDCLSEIYSLEALSEHPLALAVVEYAKGKNAEKLEVENFKQIEGGGLEGEIAGNRYAVGNLRLAEERCAIQGDVKSRAEALADEGKTPLFIVKNEKLIGIIAVKDTLKAGSAEAVAELKSKGIRVVMLTGDNEKTANVIAREVGIDEVIANVRPEDKHRIVEGLKTDGKHLVAMVGDGVNDAPALSAADLGIAVGGGSDVAIESSDIVLLRRNLMDVASVIRLSKRVLNTIKLGLFWAFFYNAVCVLIATGAFYYVNPAFKINPMIGALAMSVSSVSVVLNALTINFFKVKKTADSEAPIPEKTTDLTPEETANSVPEEAVEKAENNEGNEQKISGKINENELENGGIKMKEYVLKVDGMMCGMCEAHVNNAVRKAANVKSVSASHSSGTVKIKADEELNLDAIKKAIEDEGYKVL